MCMKHILSIPVQTCRRIKNRALLWALSWRIHDLPVQLSKIYVMEGRSSLDSMKTKTSLLMVPSSKNNSINVHYSWCTWYIDNKVKVTNIEIETKLLIVVNWSIVSTRAQYFFFSSSMNIQSFFLRSLTKFSMNIWYPRNFISRNAATRYKNAALNCTTSVTKRTLSISESILSNGHSAYEVHHIESTVSLASVELYQNGLSTNFNEIFLILFYTLKGRVTHK